MTCYTRKQPDGVDRRRRHGRNPKGEVYLIGHWKRRRRNRENDMQCRYDTTFIEFFEDMELQSEKMFVSAANVSVA